MAKIFNVDFQRKRLKSAHSDYEDQQKQLQQVSYDILQLHLYDLTQLIRVICKDDPAYADQCANTIRDILYQLKLRSKS